MVYCYLWRLKWWWELKDGPPHVSSRWKWLVWSGNTHLNVICWTCIWFLFLIVELKVNENLMKDLVLFHWETLLIKIDVVYRKLNGSFFFCIYISINTKLFQKESPLDFINHVTALYITIFSISVIFK